jgi:diketogulonate reductase-like aldo/keto reductase
MTDSDRKLPSFIYGTAWKKERTAAFVEAALRTGFKAVDTANQPKHYDEPLAGEALTAAVASGTTRESLFIQTKFTPLNGQDHRVPYDPKADLRTQVEQSFASSLQHLRTDYIDSYLLHGPYSYPGLGSEDWEVWNAMEDIYTSGQAKMIGISNVNAMQLGALVERARVKPMAVQNRCFANRGWDRAVRQICAAYGIMYQGFSLLTANPYVLHRAEVMSLAYLSGVRPEQVIFRFAMQVGMVPLTGTTDPQHMKEDLSVYKFSLSRDEVDLIEAIEG